MDHSMQVDKLCLKLSAVGGMIGDDEKFVVLLGSLPQEYDVMIKIIEESDVTILEAKEILWRDYETFQIRDTKEMAF